MPNENGIDLSTINDMTQLRELYITFNEQMVAAQEQAQMNSQNLQAVRQRMVQIHQEIDAKVAKETAKK